MKKIFSILLATIILCSNFTLLSFAVTTNSDYLSADNPIYHKSLDMIDVNWYIDHSTTVSNSGLDGIFIDQDGVQYDISTYGNTATIEHIYVEHDTKTIVIPEIITLYSIEIIENGSISINGKTKHSEPLHLTPTAFRWSFPGVRNARRSIRDWIRHNSGSMGCPHLRLKETGALVMLLPTRM